MPRPFWRERDAVHRRTRDFTMEGVHVVDGRVRESGGRKTTSGVQGQSPGPGIGVPHAVTETKCEIAYNF